MKENYGRTHDEVTISVLNAAYNAWSGAADLRKNRCRNKNFTYGKQLDDVVVTPDGECLTEKEMLINSGREPLTNNMIRQLVKSVVGRYRSLAKKSGEVSDERLDEILRYNVVEELDSRVLEEFLISGCCIQKVDLVQRLGDRYVAIDNVNVNKFFINAITDPRALDCNIVGQLHDMTVSEIIMRLACNDREKAAWIREVYSQSLNERICYMQSRVGYDGSTNTGFWNGSDGKCRIIEVWTLESHEVYKCHDYKKGDWYLVPADDYEQVVVENKLRSKNGEPEIKSVWNIAQVWHCRWISPMGDLIAEYDSPYAHGSHPYVVKMYPLTDGEVHAFVEDVIDQQKYVNRLISLVDHIMNVSAKGVLLYPADALPAGFTWQDIKRLWRSPEGIIPYETGRNNMPRQISTNATNIGAYELLSLEMKLFEDISGVSGAFQGKTAANAVGAQRYEKEAENAIIALADIYETFKAFVQQRNDKVMTTYIEPENC